MVGTDGRILFSYPTFTFLAPWGSNHLGTKTTGGFSHIISVQINGNYAANSLDHI